MPDQEEYADALIWRLENLRDEIAERREQVQVLLEEINVREQQAQQIIDLLEADSISVNGSLGGLGSMSVADMAYEVLSNFQEPTPLHYRELAEAIMAAGKLIPGQDPAANLISHISRDERFMRVDRGTYALAKWGLQPAKKRRSTKKRKR